MSERSTRLTRRDFLKLISVGVGAALTGCELDLSEEEEDKNTSLKISEFLKQIYKFNNFYFGDGYVLGHTDLFAYPVRFGYKSGTTSLVTLNSALSLYPPSLYDNLNRINPWSILVSENLAHFNAENNTWEDWGGTILDAFSGEQILCSERQDIFRITHHELFHHIVNSLIDRNQFYLEISTINSMHGVTDYKTEESFENASACLNTPEPGFARCYGEWNVSEDAATVAEGVMTGTQNFYERIKTDLALGEKAKRIKLVYENVSSGLMNEDFFKTLESHPVNPWSWPEITRDVTN